MTPKATQSNFGNPARGSELLDIRSIAMGLVFALMWSSAFTSARIIVADASPLFSLALRFLVSGIIGVAIARAMGQSWHLTRRQWYATILFGLCQNALYLGLNFIAMQTIQASVAAIIASMLPLLVGLAGWLFLGERLKPLGILGIVAGFVGVAIIMGSRIGGGIDLYGLMLAGFGVLALTFATLAVRGATSGGNFLMIVGLQMLVGSAILFGATALFETIRINPTWPLALAFAYTTLVPGLAATLIWFMLVDRIGATRAATFHFLTPFFGVAIAAILLGEPLGIWDGFGVVVVTFAILAVQLARRSKINPPRDS